MELECKSGLTKRVADPAIPLRGTGVRPDKNRQDRRDRQPAAPYASLRPLHPSPSGYFAGTSRGYPSGTMCYARGAAPSVPSGYATRGVLRDATPLVNAAGFVFGLRYTQPSAQPRLARNGAIIGGRAPPGPASHSPHFLRKWRGRARR